jgi:hypothetical protein
VNPPSLRVLCDVMDLCDHAGFHSGQGRYAAATAQLQYVIVCDQCGQELRVLESVEYRPDPLLDASQEARAA